MLIKCIKVFQMLNFGLMRDEHFKSSELSEFFISSSFHFCLFSSHRFEHHGWWMREKNTLNTQNIHIIKASDNLTLDLLNGLKSIARVYLLVMHVFMNQRSLSKTFLTLTGFQKMFHRLIRFSFQTKNIFAEFYALMSSKNINVLCACTPPVQRQKLYLK